MSVLTDNDVLELLHSAKGTTWSNHKYIAIKNGRYIYPDSGGGGNSKKGSLDVDLFRSRIWRRNKARRLAKKKQKYNAYDYSIIGKARSSSSGKKSGKGSSGEKEKKTKEKVKATPAKAKVEELVEKVSDRFMNVLAKMDQETIDKLNLGNADSVKYLIAQYLNLDPEEIPESEMNELTDKIKSRYLKHVAFSEFYDDYLEHFGILGMKWGKRNGPPYPLSKLISTGRRLRKEHKEKRAANKEKRILENPKKLYKNRDKYTNEQIRSALDRIKVLSDLRDASIKKKNFIKQKIDFINGYLKSGGDTLRNIDNIRKNISNLKNHTEQEMTKHMTRLKSIAESDASIKESKNRKEKARKEEMEINNAISELERKTEEARKEYERISDLLKKVKKDYHPPA